MRHIASNSSYHVRGGAGIPVHPNRSAALRYEEPGSAPAPGYAWVDGYWAPDGSHYRWVSGRWDHPPYEGATWNHPHYGHYRQGWQLHEGHWDHENHGKDHGHERERDHDRDHDRDH
jgi:hypothetical protein